MKKLQPKEIQEGKVVHNSQESVKVLGIEKGESQSPPPRIVVFQKLGNRAEERRLPIKDFCAQYQRRKK